MSEKPTLPDGYVSWPDATITWFAAWRDSPRSDTWDEAQWQYMFDTALVHASVWGSGNFQMLGELRSRLHLMGLDFTEQSSTPKEGRVTPLHVIQNNRKRNAAAAN